MEKFIRGVPDPSADERAGVAKVLVYRMQNQFMMGNAVAKVVVGKSKA